jgi:hypothetical protein
LEVVQANLWYLMASDLETKLSLLLAMLMEWYGVKVNKYHIGNINLLNFKSLKTTDM